MTFSWKQLTALALLTGLLATEASAQGRGFRGGPPAPPPVPVSDAEKTKQALDQVFKNYPPSLRQVLQLDSSLLSNKAYLAAYPKLAEFLEGHPEVTRDPSFFIGVPKVASAPSRPAPPQIIYRNLDNLAAALFVVGLIIGIAWLVHAVVGHQKWLRVSRRQTEAQAKILERFTSNEDLLSFIQTPAGLRFLEASSMPGMADQPRAVGAPISQILWSVQIGLVLFAGGIGLDYVSPQAGDVGNGLFHIVGVVLIALGVGFVVSGASSYVLSRKFGLLNSTNVTSQTPPS